MKESNETHKPHIVRLPVEKYPEYPVTDTEVAVSIPLFHSSFDSASLAAASSERLRNVHAKGAVWSAIAMIRNTDLAARGVGIYFHVEDKIYDVVSEVFEAFEVPAQCIRQMTIDAPARADIQNPQYGKKLMCVDDTVNTERWLIVDSDAFFCSTEKRIDLYDRLKVFQNPSALTCKETSYDRHNYDQWVQGVCLGAGIPFFPDENLRLQEKRAFYAMEHWKAGNYRLPPIENEIKRVYLCTQLLMLPLKHPLIKHLRAHYKKSYQDEFLLALWQLTHGDISDLTEKIGGLSVYHFESAYADRNKALDTEGYLTHIVPDAHGDAQERIDEYYDDFFKALTSRADISSQTSISAQLALGTSDKQDTVGHQYGKFYDMIFESLRFKQQRPLRVLEVGVSAFGGGSFETFQNSDMVAKCVGLDLISYTGDLSDKGEFHRLDAYCRQTVDFLKGEYPDGFDIIIDDGTHHPDDQLFFLENYGALLSENGQLVCEDVYDADFFDRMSVAKGCYGVDLRANVGRSSLDLCNERLIVREKIEPVLDVAISQGFTEYTPPAKKRFIVLDIPYAHSGFITCAFVQRVEKWCKAMHALGHEIIFIGHKDRKVDCSEHIAIMDDDILVQAYGSANYLGVPPEHEMGDKVFEIFQERAADVIRSIAEQDDFVLAFYGYGHIDTCHAIKDLPVIVVEPSIGYTDVFTENKVYQSVYKMSFERGKADVNAYLADTYPDHPYNQHPVSMYNRMPYTTPDRNSCVIPNFFDFDHFEYREEKSDYLCFVGRITQAKGLEDVFKLVEYTNTRLIMAGPGLVEELGLAVPRQVEFVGAVEPESRSEIYAGAIAHVCPSLYLEPFLGAGVESLFGGTPHIPTNWGAGMDWCIHGKTGYRVQNFDQLVWAFENIDKISPKDCRHQALQYSKERAAISYHEYFNMLLQNKNGGRWSVNPNRTNLDWLVSDMTEGEIIAATTEIQKAVKGS